MISTVNHKQLHLGVAAGFDIIVPMTFLFSIHILLFHRCVCLYFGGDSGEATGNEGTKRMDDTQHKSAFQRERHKIKGTSSSCGHAGFT